MSELINLRQRRKRIERTRREAEAAANRAKHGRTKTERKSQKAEADKSRSLLDQAKRDPEKGS